MLPVKYSTMDPQTPSFEPEQDQPATPLPFITWKSTSESPAYPQPPGIMHPQPTHMFNLPSILPDQQNLAQHHLFAEHCLSCDPERSTSLPPFSPSSHLPQPQLHNPPYHAPEHAYCQAINSGMQQSNLQQVSEIQTLKTALHKLDSIYTQIVEHLADHSAMMAMETEIDDALREYADDILSRSSLSGIMQMSDSLEVRNEDVLLLQRVKRGWRERVEGDGRAVEAIERVREEVRGFLTEGGIEGEMGGDWVEERGRCAGFREEE